MCRRQGLRLRTETQGLRLDTHTVATDRVIRLGGVLWVGSPGGA